MLYMYMDSGTSNTRVYLLRDEELVGAALAAVGTKDSAIAGDNAVLLRGLKRLYNELLLKNGLSDSDISEIWLSGMVTNSFGIREVPHMSLPLDAKKLAAEAYCHFEDRFFRRRLMLLRGAKSVGPGQMVDFSNVETVNNVRGEEIEVVGVMSTPLAPEDGDFVVVCPGSHTHVCLVRNRRFSDILSCFTGELHHAIASGTVLSGELERGAVEMEKQGVLRGYGYLKQYGMVRALYLIHATRVFDICSDAERSQMLSGVIAGGVAELLAKKAAADWSAIKKVLVIGEQDYIAAYGTLIEEELGLPVQVAGEHDGKSFALLGFLEVLRQKNRN